MKACVVIFAVFVSGALAQTAPTDVQCFKPKLVVDEDKIPYAQTPCTWKHDGQKPLSYRFEGKELSGDMFVQENINKTNTTIDLDFFMDYEVTIYSQYVNSSGGTYLLPSKPFSFNSGPCAPPEIVWYHFEGHRTSVDLKWSPATSLYFNYTTGYNLTLVPNHDGLRSLNYITPMVLAYSATGLEPHTTYTANVFPFYKSEDGQLLKANATVFKFNTLH